jgi:cell division protein ZipA
VGEVSEVLVLNVTAKKGRLIMGERLLSLMQGLELEYGERNIFSKRTDDAEGGPILFNVANMLQPGTFDLNNMENFATVGVTLFLALPSPISNFEAFEEMLQTAQDLVRSIDGELRDDQRNMMTGQTIEHYRQRVRDFELRRLRSRAAAG